MRRSQLLREAIRRLIAESRVDVGVIYCDMDGVLVDFEAGAVDLISSILDGTADPIWTEGSKSMLKNIDRVRADLGPDWRPSNRHDLDAKGVRQILMSAVSSDPGGFFGSLPPLEDGVGELWPFLNELGPPVHILSAPIRGREGAPLTAEEGKRSWIRRHLSPDPGSIVIVEAKDKQNWAITDGVPNLLVDDKGSTIESWNGRGGIGILHVPGDSTRSIDEIRQKLSL